MNWGMKWRPPIAALNTIQVAVVFPKAVRVQAVALKLQVACSCSTQDYEVHVCHCKQFEDQVKQLTGERSC